MPKTTDFAGIAFYCACILLIALLVEGTRNRIARRSAATLDRWAADNDYEILAQKVYQQAWLEFWKFGPFWTSHWGQPVYRLTVLDQSGVARDAWVRCGYYWCGFWWENVEVKWVPSKTRIIDAKAPPWDQELDG